MASQSTSSFIPHNSTFTADFPPRPTHNLPKRPDPARSTSTDPLDPSLLRLGTLSNPTTRSPRRRRRHRNQSTGIPTTVATSTDSTNDLSKTLANLLAAPASTPILASTQPLPPRDTLADSIVLVVGELLAQRRSFIRSPTTIVQQNPDGIVERSTSTVAPRTSGRRNAKKLQVSTFSRRSEQAPVTNANAIPIRGQGRARFELQPITITDHRIEQPLHTA